MATRPSEAATASGARPGRLRIVAGQWRGRSLLAPPGQTTRPTADRVRQALFDILAHAPWAAPPILQGAQVLDGFAGTGALGLEALSRGAAAACFIEQDAAALLALRANITACRAAERCEVEVADLLQINAGPAATLIFLDPPYGQALVPRGLSQLCRAGRVADGAVVVAELGRDEGWMPERGLLAERTLGAARIVVFRAGDAVRDQ